MLLVAGATGSLGTRITRRLLDQGRPVRILVRAGSDHAALAAAGADVAVGNLKDPESLERACGGVHTVITTASASRRGDDSIENVDRQGNLNLVDAAVVPACAT